MDYKKIAMEKHAEWAGKIEVVSRAKVENVDDLSIAYTPGTFLHSYKKTQYGSCYY